MSHWEDDAFVMTVISMPAVALFILWLRSSDEPQSVAVGNWSALGMLVLVALLLVRRR